MRMLKPHFLPSLMTCIMLLSGCASSYAAEEQSPSQVKVATQEPVKLPACPSKWIAAGNNGAKADRYFQVFCR